MRKLLVLFGAFLLFICPLFGTEKNNDKGPVLLELSQEELFEELSAITYPPTSPVILPYSLQYLAEHSPSDQFKKIKAFLGSSFNFFYHKSLFPALLDTRVSNPVLSNPLFILFRNLRL
jgi:hypothetical protein